MGGFHHNPRVRIAVPTPAPSLQPGQDDYRQRPSEGLSPEPGVVRPPGQGSHRASGPSAAPQRLLFKILPRGEERWRIPSHSRPEGTQQVPEGNTISHAHRSRHTAGGYQGGVVHHRGLEGRVLPRPDCTTPSALPEVCFSRPAFSVQGTSLRPLPLSKGVHQSCGSSSRTPANAGHEGTAISRRLAGLRTVPGSGGRGYGSAASARGPAGPDGESAEKSPGPNSADHIPGDGSRLRRHEGLSVTEAGGRHPPPPPPLRVWQDGAIHPVPPAPGQTYSCLSCGASRLAVLAATADVAKQPPSGPQVAQAPEGQGVAAMPPLSVPMEKEVLSVGRRTHGRHPVPPGVGRNGRLPLGMGSGVAGQDCPGAVAGPQQRTYQRARAPCGAISTPPLFASVRRQTRAGQVGQQVHGCPNQPPRGYSVYAVTPGISEPADLGISPPGQRTSSVHPRGPESGRGLPVATEAPTGGVAASPGGGGEDMGSLRQGGSGPLCFRGIRSLPPLVLLDGGDQPPRTGCLGARLATEPSVCIPTTATDSSHTPEGAPAGSQATPGGPLLARESLVSTAAQALLQLSMAPPLQEGPPVSTGGSNLAPRPPPPPALDLATAGPDPLLRFCTATVRNTILNARAPSTRAQYENRWKLFSDWCNRNAADPVRCPVATVLEFLQSLLDSGRSHSTLRVYASAISSRHERVDGATVGGHRLVSLFLRGALRLRPPRTLRAPAWDLPLVLEAMSLPPFEPLTQVGLKWLSMKVAFLLAITSAKRVGELQALSVAETCLRWNPDGSGVVLWPNVAFLPKVLSRTHLNQPIRLSRFDSPSEEGRSEMLCPVRALKAYIAATASFRQSEQLFVCHGGPNRGCALSKQRLSHWVVDAIKHAYGASGRPPPSGVRCHSTRSITTSWAALRGVPLEAICAAASWATPDTFTRFYRVNVADHYPMEAVLRPSPAASNE